MKYILKTVVEEVVIREDYFESEYVDCDINPYADYVPVVVASNQFIVKAE